MNTFTILEDKHYDLLVIAVRDEEYAVAPSAEAARAAARQVAMESLWATNVSTLVYHSSITELGPDDGAGLIKALKLVREQLSEDANPLFKALLPGELLDNLLDDVMDSDGLGNSLSYHDGKESFFGDVFEDAEVDLTECKKELLAATGAMNVEDLLFYRIR